MIKIMKQKQPKAICKECKTEYTDWLSDSIECPECEGEMIFLHTQPKEENSKCEHKKSLKEATIPYPKNYICRVCKPSEPKEENEWNWKEEFRAKLSELVVSFGNWNRLEDFVGILLAANQKKMIETLIEEVGKERYNIKIAKNDAEILVLQTINQALEKVLALLRKKLNIQ